MFDLNEIPDQIQLLPDPFDNDSIKDGDRRRGLPPIPGPRSRSRDPGDDVSAMAVEPLPPKRSSPHSSSALTFDLSQAQLPGSGTGGETSLEHDSRVEVADLLGRKSGMLLSFHQDASTSGKRVDSLAYESAVGNNRRNISSKKSLELRKLVDDGGEQDADAGAAEGWFSLSIGGSGFRSPSRRSVDLMRCNSKSFDTTELAVGIAKESTLSSRTTSVLSPFWRGSLRTDAALTVPLDAFCLGIMAPESMLKKLPTTLNAQKLVKLDEVQKILLNGVAEPLTQFKPSSGASAEEVEIFTSMIETWTQDFKPLALDVSLQSPLAALISWDDDLDYKLDVKFYLISSTNLKMLLKSCQLDMLPSLVKESNILDSGSLYGVVCCGSANMAANSVDTIRTVTENERKNMSVSKTGKSNAILSHASENGRDMAANSNSSFIMSPSHSRNNSKRLQFLNKSASMETQRVSSIDADERHEDRGSKRRYQRQLSSLDVLQGGGKHAGSGIVYEEDFVIPKQDKFHSNYGRSSRRAEWRSDRLKDTIRDEWRSDRLKDTIRGNLEDRYSSRGRVREQQRHSYLEGQRGQKSKENQGYQDDMLGKKERDTARKNNILGEVKSFSETSFVPSKISLSLLESESGKEGRKRDRQQEMDDLVLTKRQRESEVRALEHEQANVGCEDLRMNIGDMKLGFQSQRQSRPIEKRVCTDLTINSHDLNERLEDDPRINQMGCDGVLRTKDAGSQDMGIVKPLLSAMLEENRGSNISSLSEADGPTELDLSCKVLKLPSNEVVEELQRTKRSGSVTQSFVEAAKEEPFLEFQVDVIDKETRTWLTSKQNVLYLQEEFGVETVVNLESSNVNTDLKADSQNSVLQVRVSMPTSEFCDAGEAKWFVDQAALAIRSISTRGVFIKCLWYNGPVNMHAGDGAPSVQSIVKKIKGDDGKNLERIQDETGVMIGVVLRKNGVAALNEVEPLSHRSFIGLRLKCVRKKGLLDALQTAEALLEDVAEHFSKELEVYMANHASDMPDAAQQHHDTVLNQDYSSTHGIYTKELLPNSPLKFGEENIEASMGSPNLDGVTGELQESIQRKEEHEESLLGEKASRPLYVSNLPDHITPIKIRNIFDTVLREKLEGSGDLDNVSEFVMDVRYIPEKYCAFVELANDELLSASLKLYAENKSVFHGLSVELGLSPNNKTERQTSFSRSGVRNRNGGEPSRSPFLGRSKSDSYGRKQFGALDDDSDSDYSHDLRYGDYVGSNTNHVLDKPRPLFLSELMRNASAQTIKQLFEDIITTYLGPSLLNASGKQLVLDVRYVPSRGCAFVDLATRQLVEFMLDLHSRRPEVFLNMKMELGRRPVEDDADRRLNLRNRDGVLGKSQSYGFRLTSIGSRKKLEKRSSGSYLDYLEESDMADDFSRQTGRSNSKKLRSDPEKTIYADRLPESASEGMIKKIFERVLLQTLTQEELEAFGDQLITEVRHVPSKYCAFIVFASEELTRMVLHMYNEDENAFESMRLKPHFHSRLEDLYKEDLHDVDDVIHTPSFKERIPNIEADIRPHKPEIYDSRSSRSAVHRAITASAFKEVDRRRSVYVDRIPEDLSESTMTEMFEKSFRHKKHGHDGHMVSQVAYFRDKFDANKLCAFVELKTEEGTQDLIDFYNENPDAFQGVRVRPGFKYSS